MRRIKDFNTIKTGDWLLSLESPKVVFVIKNKISQIYIFNKSGGIITNKEKRRRLNYIIKHHLRLGRVYKLNKKDREMFNKEIILENL